MGIGGRLWRDVFENSIRLRRKSNLKTMKLLS
jgi:hypothetical protein